MITHCPALTRWTAIEPPIRVRHQRLWRTEAQGGGMTGGLALLCGSPQHRPSEALFLPPSPLSPCLPDIGLMSPLSPGGS